MDNLDDLWDVEDGGLQGGLANETRLHDGDGALEELFGDEGGEEEALAGDDAPLQPPSPVGRGPSAAEERRRAMQELARRHQPQGRGEGGGSSDGEGGAKKKKRKRDKDKGGSKGGGAGDEDGGRRGRRLRKTGEERGGGAGAGAGGSGDEGGGGGVGGGGGEEDELAPETDADRAFIDDDGVPEHQRYRDNPEADEGGEPEAEEAEEGEEGSEGGFVVGEGEEEGEEDGIDGVVKRRKKKEQDTELQLQAAAESMVAKMNIAAELDEGCVKASKPATHKVKELPAAEAFLRQRKNHEYFIIHGGLKAAARWLTPYDNGTMPTLLVRSKLVELLSLLPLNTSIDSLRDVLQRSGLGKVVNFHATFDGDGSDREESVKRAYRKLLHAWVAPIVHDPEAEREKRDRQSAALARQRKLALERSKADADALARRREADAQLQPGQKGFRRHAYIPTAAKLDYVHNPGRPSAAAGAAAAAARRRAEEEDDENFDGGAGAMAAVAPEPGARGGGGGGGGGRAGPELSPLAKKMRDMQKLRKGATARAAKVSVEGRNITLM